MLTLKEALEQRTGMDCIVRETYNSFDLWFASQAQRQDFLETYTFLFELDTGDVFKIWRNAVEYHVVQIDIGFYEDGVDPPEYTPVPVWRYGVHWEWDKPHEAKDLWDRLHWLLYPKRKR